MSSSARPCSDTIWDASTPRRVRRETTAAVIIPALTPASATTIPRPAHVQNSLILRGTKGRHLLPSTVARLAGRCRHCCFRSCRMYRRWRGAPWRYPSSVCRLHQLEDAGIQPVQPNALGFSGDRRDRLRLLIPDPCYRSEGLRRYLKACRISVAHERLSIHVQVSRRGSRSSAIVSSNKPVSASAGDAGGHDHAGRRTPARPP